MARISFKKIRDDQPRESFSGLMETVKSIVFGDNLELGEGSNKYGVFSSELVVTGNREKKMNVAEVYLTTALVYVLDGAGKKASLVTFEKYAEGKYLEANTGET
ncbi:MAG: hypothetical protein KAH32_00700, partial [Chlamydiia bacterium]|nr:hypothetical protein [Chlamydiia bacterium]